MNRFSIRTQNIISVLAAVFVSTVLLYTVLKWSGSAKEKPSIVVYSYSDMLTHEAVERFEAETGITVLVKHFDAVEELMTMLVFAKGSCCDVVMPTDAMVEVLREADLLHPLDKTKLPHFAEVDPRITGNFYDPENEHTVPFAWEPLGLGYDTRVVNAPRTEIGLDLLFGRFDSVQKRWLSPAEIYGPGVTSVCLGEDPWEAFFLTSLFLWRSIDDITHAKQEEILNVLIRQRGWLESYTNNMKYFLISRIAPVVVMPSAHALDLHEEYSYIDFVVPKEGSLLILGEMGIPKVSQQREAAHAFINYMLSREAGAQCAALYRYNPANRYAYESMPESVLAHPFFSPILLDPRSLAIAHNKLDLADVEALWYRLKASS